MNIQTLLTKKIEQAMLDCGADVSNGALVRVSAKAQFGDYQANGIMAAAKKAKKNPRQLAEEVITQLNLDGIADKIEIAGPGFINIFLNPVWMAQHLSEINQDPRLGISSPAVIQTVVADYSAPNVAKEMHVGHLRSTIIGDAVVRVLEFMGHNVVRANHVGDWGTQFGMLIAYLEKVQNEQAADLELSDLEVFYRTAKAHYDSDELFAEKARSYVVKLQGGDEYCLKMWRKLVDITMQQNQKAYDRLNVTLNNDNVMGESLYNPMLPGLVADLMAKGIAVKDQGAVVVFLNEFKNKDGDPLGVIIQKSDGGYLYATTDIACAKYRYETLNADRILYFTDSRQSQHLQQVWSIVHQAGYVPEDVVWQHFNFGMMLGKDNKPFKTRSGDTVKLAALLDEAQERAEQLISEKNPELDDETKSAIAEAVGIGAIKYADLSKNRTTDYVFDWDNMLNFEGNTAPYMQYAYTRVRSIFKRSGIENMETLAHPIVITEDKERALALTLLRFDEAISSVAKDGIPHILCNYIYELAGNFSSFYEHCPILSTEDEQIKNSRLQLAALTAKVLKQSLDLLGIKTVDKM